MATAPGEDDELEVYNDDGFVYKRKKRRLNTDPSSSSAPPESGTDPDAEKHRRERMKNYLLKLKNQYQKEIDRWENLSNSLDATQERIDQEKRQDLEQQQEQPSSSASAIGSEFRSPNASKFASSIDELLLQVEAQEAIIRDIFHLCDVAEAFCKAQEEDFKKSFFDLPVWGSPRELVASLCDEEDEASFHDE